MKYYEVQVVLAVFCSIAVMLSDILQAVCFDFLRF
jgi:hypothetical protein